MKDEAIILEMFHGGYAVDLISDKINVPAVSIHKYLKRNNLSRPRYSIRYKRPKSHPVIDEVKGTSIYCDCLRVLNRMLAE